MPLTRNRFLKLLTTSALMYPIKDLQALYQASEAWPNSQKMPVLFLGHGSPMNAVEENSFVQGFRRMAKTLPLPRVILCISAHWLTKGTHVTAMEMPRTIHDFGGFPKELYAIQYPAAGHPELAKNVSDLLTPVPVGLDLEWGLDHGAWTVLMHLFPEANIPVVQLSIDYYQPMAYHYSLAQRLALLRHKGVLIVGSGNIVHNLAKVDFKNFHKENYGYDWAHEVHQKVNAYILNHDHSPLLEYARLGAAFRLAIPTPDHYIPLLYALALQDENEPIELFNDRLLAGSLSMTSVKIGT